MNVAAVATVVAVTFGVAAVLLVFLLGRLTAVWVASKKDKLEVFLSSTQEEITHSAITVKVVKIATTREGKRENDTILVKKSETTARGVTMRAL